MGSIVGYPSLVVSPGRPLRAGVTLQMRCAFHPRRVPSDAVGVDYVHTICLHCVLSRAIMAHTGYGWCLHEGILMPMAP